MIPKVLHFIWVGNNPLPEYSLKNINAFKSIYDDYRVILWTDGDVIKNNLIPDFLHEYYFNNEFAHAFKADILRYIILYKFGGLYFDTDFEPLKKLNDSFLSFDFLGGIQTNNEVAIGFIGSAENNELIKNAINAIPISIRFAIDNHFYLPSEIHKITGPEFFNKIACQYKNESTYFFFTKEYFYPYWFTEIDRRNENFKETSPLAYAVHHWEKSWK
jgi:mannosyltransferase OCH1-like enzyme